MSFKKITVLILASSLLTLSACEDAIHSPTEQAQMSVSQDNKQLVLNDFRNWLWQRVSYSHNNYQFLASLYLQDNEWFLEREFSLTDFSPAKNKYSQQEMHRIEGITNKFHKELRILRALSKPDFLCDAPIENNNPSYNHCRFRTDLNSPFGFVKSPPKIADLSPIEAKQTFKRFSEKCQKFIKAKHPHLSNTLKVEENFKNGEVPKDPSLHRENLRNYQSLCRKQRSLWTKQFEQQYYETAAKCPWCLFIKGSSDSLEVASKEEFEKSLGQSLLIFSNEFESFFSEFKKQRSKELKSLDTNLVSYLSYQLSWQAYTKENPQLADISDKILIDYFQWLNEQEREDERNDVAITSTCELLGSFGYTKANPRLLLKLTQLGCKAHVFKSLFLMTTFFDQDLDIPGSTLIETIKERPNKKIDNSGIEQTAFLEKIRNS